MSIARAWVRFKRNCAQAIFVVVPNRESFVERRLIGEGRQVERQPAGAALLREDSTRCAPEIVPAASRTLEGIEFANVERAYDQRNPGARKRPSNDRTDEVIVADQVGDGRASNHSRKEGGNEVELALRQRYARQCGAIVVGDYRRWRRRDSRIFKQVQFNSSGRSRCRALPTASIRKCR